ncbi:MAG TPA: ribosome recycling factor [Candidatus Limnocylindrales bacterium]|nr:ribosome recycling factor [Candidatus Limnocylindrales bacterium]
MGPQQIIDDAKTKFQAANERFQTGLKSLRTGRASASMLDGVMVEAYGTQMPLIQVATITAPEAQLIQVSPFDPSTVQAIAAAIRNNPNLGMNPSDDGRVVRIPVPPLTEERRRDIVKQVGQKQEDCMVQLRGVRHDALAAIDKMKKAKEIGEDDAKRLEKQVDDAMAAARAQAEAASKAKEAEVMTV